MPGSEQHVAGLVFTSRGLIDNALSVPHTTLDDRTGCLE